MPFDVLKVKASVAYERSLSKQGILAQEFPFRMAFTDLCGAKASTAGLVPATRSFTDFSLLHPLLLHASRAED